MFEIPLQFLTSLREPINMHDMKYAYAHNLIDKKTFSSYVTYIAAEGEHDREDAQVFSVSNEPNQSEQLAERVACPAESTPEQNRKWALILASFIIQSNISDKLAAIENLYSELNYPEDLARFVRYMPMSGPDMGSREANENRMLESLKSMAADIVNMP